MRKRLGMGGVSWGGIVNTSRSFLHGESAEQHPFSDVAHHRPIQQDGIVWRKYGNVKSEFASKSAIPPASLGPRSDPLQALCRRCPLPGRLLPWPSLAQRFNLPGLNFYPSTTAMKDLRCPTQSPIILLLFFTFFSLFPFFVIAGNDCPPATWQSGPVRSAATTRTPAVTFKASASVANLGNAEPGQVNCRYSANTKNDVNCCTCAQLAKRYGITLEVFFMLNPDVNPDCGNIEQNTKYCVAGCKCHKYQ